MFALIVVALCSLLVSFFLTPFCRDLFVFLEVVDKPDAARKIHTRPVPRAGGVPLVVSYFVAALALLLLGVPGRALFNWHDPSIELMLRLLPAVALIFGTGLLDDIKGLTPIQKLTGQIGAAGYACWAGVRLATPPGYPAILIDLVSIFWLVFCANAINLIDGIDGLAAGVALLASLSLLMASVLHHHPELALTMAPLIGGLLGFLYYNSNPASVFLGDSGSLLIGFLLGCAGIMWNRHASTGLGMAAPLVALVFPLLEVMLSICRRFLRIAPIFGADSNHIHHRLLSMGFSQRSAAMVLYGVSATAALLAVFQTILRPQLATVMLLVVLATAWVGFRSLKYPEFGVLGQFLFAGEFRRAMRATIHLKEFKGWLAASVTIEECWLALRNTCRQAKFHYVALHVGEKSFVDGYVKDPDAGGRMNIQLAGSDSVTFGCYQSKPELTMLIGPIVAELRAKLASSEFLSPTLVPDAAPADRFRSAVAG